MVSSGRDGASSTTSWSKLPLRDSTLSVIKHPHPRCKLPGISSLFLPSQHAYCGGARGSAEPLLEVSWPSGLTLDEALAKPRPKVVRERFPAEPKDQRFWETGLIWYKSPNGDQPERPWEMVRRKQRNTSADGKPLEAADVLAIVRRKGREPAVVLVLNYRPPVDTFVVELPAGLVDEGETALEAAVRELKEETGFTATKELGVYGPCYPDPWKGTESYMSCTVEVDGDIACNRSPSPKLEEDEHFAAVLLVPISNFSAVLGLLASRGCKLETRTVAIGQTLDVLLP
eukprot:TRINITY_DN45180_c0_g1_i2.p1 TRINITY_DN45180_c0_g1~~TRINITY_DN45180_c0_g1_i2.p1  ORF type:complete len:337 (-),score=34.16 TRINITY_DN45180_c0_g1_i2:133-993(-)